VIRGVDRKQAKGAGSDPGALSRGLARCGWAGRMALAPFLAALLIVLSGAPALAQQPAAAPSAQSPTLGEWITRDKAAAALPPGTPRDAAIAAQHQSLLEGLRLGRTAEEARAAAGAPPTACLPPPGQGRLTADEVGTWLHARPAGEHGEPLARVIRRLLAERYPCP
jgi:hypothetical protein